MSKVRFALITSIIVLFVACAATTAWRWHKRTPHLVIDMHRLEKLERVVPVAIIGSGPAGLSAAVYSSRANFHTVIFEGKKPGGQLMDTSDVENWPGIAKLRGSIIMDQLRTQALSFHATASPATIEKIDCSRWPFTLTTDGGTEIKALAIIMTTGARHKMLDVPGEKTYWGHGVTACATCDAAFYKDKEVIVVGGGDTAAEDALQLTSHASLITILVRGDAMRASYALQQRLKAYPHIKIRYRTQVTEVLGNNGLVTGVMLKTPEGSEEMKVAGIFLAVGHAPNSELLVGQVALEDHGFIKTDGYSQRTSVPGVFAAGDVSDPEYHQAGVSAGDGIKAALDAVRFLADQGFNDQIATQLQPRLYYPPKAIASTFELLKIDNERQFEDEIIESELPVLVDFYTPSCPSCLQMLPTLQAVAAEYQGKVKVVKVDGAHLPQLMKRFKVSSVPCCIVFKKGVATGRTTALMNQGELHRFFTTIIS